MNVLPLHVIFGVFILGMVLFFGVLIYLERSGWMFGRYPNRAGELFTDNQVLTGSIEGRKYRYVYLRKFGEDLGTPDKSSFGPSFQIAVDCLSKGNFRIVKENWVDILLKNMGMFREVQTGDVDFDKKFYIQTDFPLFASSFLKETGTRKMIEEIFQMGFTEFEHDGSVIKAKWKPFVIMGDFDTSLVEKTGKSLVSLVRVMLDTLDVTVESGISYLRIQRKATFAISYLLVSIGFYIFPYGESHYRPLVEDIIWDSSLSYILPLFAVFAGYVLFLFKGSASSYRKLLILLGISLAGFVFSGVGLATVINGAADTGKMIVNTVKVIEKVESKSKYYVHVKSWRSDTIRLNVSYETYNTVQPYQSRFNVYTKPGRLGFEWLAGWEVYQPKDKWDV